MFLLDLLRYFTGYVYFSAKGGFAERFLNLCNENGIHLKDVELWEEIIYGSVSARKYRSLMNIARQSGVKLKAERKYGLLFFVRKNKKRAGLVLGAVLSVVFLLYTSSFIWTIEVTGGEKISEASVINACENLGLYEGVKKKNIDTNELSRRLIMELSGKVAWISVNVKGTKATVELRDYARWQEDKTFGEPSNIIADFDGLLMTVEVYNGVKIAREGNGVKEGDLLISGIAENRDTSSQLMEARGRITAKHSVLTETKQKNNNQFFRYKETENIYVLNLFGISIPLGRFKGGEDTYHEFTYKKNLFYGEQKLPLSISVITRVKYEFSKAEDTDNLYIAIDKHTVDMYQKFKNTLLLSGKSSIEKNREEINIKTTNECIDFMGIREEINIE